MDSEKAGIRANTGVLKKVLSTIICLKFVTLIDIFKN